MKKKCVKSINQNYTLLSSVIFVYTSVYRKTSPAQAYVCFITGEWWGCEMEWGEEGERCGAEVGAVQKYINGIVNEIILRHIE